jgi:O-6-methylguanine DNA methyltransferase
MESKTKTSFAKNVYAVVAKIPKGKTMTYGQVARKAGRPGAARAVGNLMHNNPDLKNIPCHRVIRSDGSIGGYLYGTKKKIEMLRREGAIK